MSALVIIGWALVAVGAVLLVAAVVRARRSETLPPIAPNPLSEQGLSMRQAMRIIKRSYGRGPVPPGQSTLVRAYAQHSVDHPLTHELGFVAVGIIFAGVAALTWTPVGGALLAAVGVMVMVFPLAMRRRLRRSRRVLEEIPPG